MGCSVSGGASLCVADTFRCTSEDLDQKRGCYIMGFPPQRHILISAARTTGEKCGAGPSIRNQRCWAQVNMAMYSFVSIVNQAARGLTKPTADACDP